jgi:hypothetical protein
MDPGCSTRTYPAAAEAQTHRMAAVAAPRRGWHWLAWEGTLAQASEGPIDAGYCQEHGRWQGQMRDERGSDVVIAIGRGGTAPSDGFAIHEHQRRRREQSDCWGDRAYPCPPIWRHACAAPHAVVTGLGAGQRAVGSLGVWQKGDGWVRHRDVLQGHQSNGGDVACEGANSRRERRGEVIVILVWGMRMGRVQ